MSSWQLSVQFDRPEIWTSDLLLQIVYDFSDNSADLLYSLFIVLLPQSLGQLNYWDMLHL